METLAHEPANADNTASVEATEVDSEVVETEGADPASAAAETGKPERDKVQERFDKLTREKYEGLSRAERAEYRAQLLEQRLAQLEAAQPAKTTTVAPSDDYPTLESVGFDDEAHRAAVAEWVKRQTGESVKSVLAQEREAAQRAEAERAHERREAEFIKSKPDYAEKVFRLPSQGGPAITDQMAEVIRASDIGPEVAYYLAENVAKSVEIARLPAHLQAREIGRIEARLEAAKANPVPAVSKAPPPAARIDAVESSVDKNPDDMSIEEWKKWRDKRDRLNKLRK